MCRYNEGIQESARPSWRKQNTLAFSKSANVPPEEPSLLNEHFCRSNRFKRYKFDTAVNVKREVDNLEQAERTLWQRKTTLREKTMDRQDK